MKVDPEVQQAFDQMFEELRKKQREVPVVFDLTEDGEDHEEANDGEDEEDGVTW